MWVRCSNGALVNLDNCTSVTKQTNTRTFAQSDGYSASEQVFTVVVLDAGSECVVVEKNLTEEQADKMLSVLWKAIPAEDSVDASWVES